MTPTNNDDDEQQLRRTKMTTNNDNDKQRRPQTTTTTNNDANKQQQRRTTTTTNNDNDEQQRQQTTTSTLGRVGLDWVGSVRVGGEGSQVEIKGKMKTSKEETMRKEQEEETRSGKKVKRNTD